MLSVVLTSAGLDEAPPVKDSLLPDLKTKKIEPTCTVDKQERKEMKSKS